MNVLRKYLYREMMFRNENNFTNTYLIHLDLLPIIYFIKH